MVVVQICRENVTTDADYMTCNIIGKPCCVGVSGECVITTSDYCQFLRGYYHPDAFLCSQVLYSVVVALIKNNKISPVFLQTRLFLVQVRTQLRSENHSCRPLGRLIHMSS